MSSSSASASGERRNSLITGSCSARRQAAPCRAALYRQQAVLLLRGLRFGGLRRAPRTPRPYRPPPVFPTAAARVLPKATWLPAPPLPRDEAGQRRWPDEQMPPDRASNVLPCPKGRVQLAVCQAGPPRVPESLNFGHFRRIVK